MNDGKYSLGPGVVADRLRAFWQLESDPIVGKLISDLIDYAVSDCSYDDFDDRIVKCKAIAQRLTSATPTSSPSNTLNANDINATTVVVGTQTIIHNHGPGAEDVPKSEKSAGNDTRLLEILKTKFSSEDLSSLAFMLDIEYEDLAGDTKTAKAISLIGYCQRHDKLDQLRDAVRRARPNVVI